MKPVYRIATILFPAAMAFGHAFAAEDGAIPQMDPTWYANQLFWLGVSFLVLYIIVSRLIIPSVGSVLSTRKNTIAEAIAAAEAYKKNAQATRGDFESRAHAVHEQVNAMMAEAKANAAHRTAAAMAKLNAELETKTDRALQELERALAAAQPAMEAATADVARAMAEKLLGRAVDARAVTNAKNAA